MCSSWNLTSEYWGVHGLHAYAGYAMLMPDISTFGESYLTYPSLHLEPASPHSHQQNGGAEGSGRIIQTRARSMCIEAGLPEYLWPWAMKTSTDVGNLLTPVPDQPSPHEKLAIALNTSPSTRKPYVRHLRRWGCRAYVHVHPDSHLYVKGRKMRARAELGRLMGYDGLHGHIFFILMDRTNKIQRARDVDFKEDEEDIPLVEFDDIWPTEEVEDEPVTYGQEITAAQKPSTALNQSTSEPDEASPPTQDRQGDQPEEAGQDSIRQDDENQVVEPTEGLSEGVSTKGGTSRKRGELPTPSPEPDEATQPQPDAATLQPSVEDEITVRHSPQPPTRGRPKGRPRGSRPAISTRPQSTEPSSSTRPLRERKPYDPKAFDKTFGNLALGGMALVDENLDEDFCGFGFSATDLAQALGSDITLPTTFKKWQSLKDGPLKQAVWEAMETQVNSLKGMNCWKIVDLPPGQQWLPGKWVYDKKIKADGTLDRVRARWVVCGNFQEKDNKSVFAAVANLVAMRLFLLLVAVKDLELHQVDVITAFLNATMDGRDVYIHQPYGFEDGTKRVCHLLRALYGLRDSPLLWYKEIVSRLVQMGFKPLAKEPCILIHPDGLMVLLYVDDLLVAAPLLAQVTDFKSTLNQHFSIKDLSEARQFLGFEIFRDRSQRKLWISQATYVKTMLADKDITNPTKLPCPANDPWPPEITKNPRSVAEMYQYQSDLGKI